MVTTANIITSFLILFTAVWGQYWRDKAKHYEGVLLQLVEEMDAKEKIE